MLRNLRTLALAAAGIVAVCSTTLIAQETAPPAQPAQPAQPAPPTPPAGPPELVDINSAPVAQINLIVENEALAGKIVEGRPYANKRQLLSREFVSPEQYEQIKDRIIARQPPEPETP